MKTQLTISMTLLVSVAIVLTLPATLLADNWPQWRGPLGRGVGADGEYPVEFSATDHVRWKVPLPGSGRSTPAVWQDRIFVTSGIDGQDCVTCYDLDGNELWQQAFGPERPGKHDHASGSNPSPVTDGTHVVAYFKSGTVACLDSSGELLWKLNLQDQYGEDTLWWDLGTSPVLAGDNVVIAVMQEGDSYLVALDLSSGDVEWKQPRKFECAKESDQSYATPTVVDVDGRRQIVCWGADHLTGHDAATGEPLWQCAGFNPNNQGMWRVIASPVVDDGIAIVPYARGDCLAAIRLGQEGDITSTNPVWNRTDLGADVPTPVVQDGRVILLTDRGRVACLDLTTGEELWSEELPRSRDKYFASPVLAGDHLYCAREDGMVFVAKVSDGFSLLAENNMGEPIYATPVPIAGDLIIRGNGHLFRIGD